MNGKYINHVSHYNALVNTVNNFCSITCVIPRDVSVITTDQPVSVHQYQYLVTRNLWQKGNSVLHKELIRGDVRLPQGIRRDGNTHAV